jgi:hypothetical protein
MIWNSEAFVILSVLSGLGSSLPTTNPRRKIPE